MLAFLIAILIVILVVAAIIGLEGLVFWGIGSFICWAFAIPFAFTFWHGYAAAMIVSILQGIFKRNDNSNNAELNEAIENLKESIKKIKRG